jgi:hypothetical protein
VSFGRHEKLTEFRALDEAETNWPAKRACNAELGESGVQSLAKALKGAKPCQRRGYQRRMRLMPTVVPQPRKMTEFGGISGSHLHNWSPVAFVDGFPS